MIAGRSCSPHKEFDISIYTQGISECGDKLMSSILELRRHVNSETGAKWQQS